ncbi:MAG: alpha/beta hydrolase [Candidatus Omnitrophica bacterium]|nr:alpha/beta hydrolase [Candidatus Omnitrophota bacterium]
MPFLTTDRGLRWHYETTGGGDPVLFIHGFGGSGRWWGAQEEFLRSGHQVIIVDLPGHGQSAWMPVTLGGLAVDLRQLISGLGISQFNVVSSSFGGLIAFELYWMVPESVMRMSFVGAIPKFARAPGYPAGLDVEKIRTLSNQFDGDYASVLEMFFRSLFTAQERGSERFKWVRNMYRRSVLPQREALKCFLDILEKTDLRGHLAGVICPVQFVTGSDDYICPRPVMARVAEHFVNARFDVMRGCGHLPFLTKPDEYNRLLEDFLIQ